MSNTIQPDRYTARHAGRRRTEHPGTKGAHLTARHHLRAALTGLLIAATLLTGLQLYAADGIAQARQAALDQARSSASPTAPAAD